MKKFFFFVVPTVLALSLFLMPSHTSVGVKSDEDVADAVSAVEEVQFRMESNGFGRWMWDPTNVRDVVVVVGTFSPDPTSYLLPEGYIVWKASVGCERRVGLLGCLYSLRNLRFSLRNRRLHGYAATSYVQYLSDPHRPKARYTVFLHACPPNISSLLNEAIAQAKKESSVFQVGTDPLPAHVTSFFDKTVSTTLGIGPKASQELKHGPGIIVPSGLLSETSLHKLFDFPRPQQFPKVIDRDDFTGWAMQLLLTGSAVPAEKDHSLAVQESTYLVQSNDMGTWAYDPEGAHLDTIVVIGGSNADPTALLVQAGYKVWRRNEDCGRVFRRIFPDAGETSIALACHEMWGYLGYLSDKSPSKPVGKRVAFVHGHLDSWHQPGHIANIIEDAVLCSEKRGDFSPLTKVRTANINRRWEERGQAAEWIEVWNKNFGSIRTIKGSRLESYCCATGVAPQHIIDKYTHEDYARFADPRLMVELGGFFYEYTWPMILNQPEVINTSAKLPECTKFTYAESIGFVKPP